MLRERGVHGLLAEHLACIAVHTQEVVLGRQQFGLSAHEAIDDSGAVLVSNVVVKVEEEVGI